MALGTQLTMTEELNEDNSNEMMMMSNDIVQATEELDGEDGNSLDGLEEGGPSSKRSAKNNPNKKRRTMSKVPVSRVSAIMRTCPNLTTVKGDAVALTSHAAELFVQELVQRTISLAEDPHHLTYNDLASVIESSELSSFLGDAIPPKITAREYYQLKARQEAANFNGESSVPTSENGEDCSEDLQGQEDEDEE